MVGPIAGDVLSMLLRPLTADDKSAAYSAVLQLQERSFTEPSLLPAMAHCTPEILPIILSDVFSEDEDVAGQALKCLGFMVYDPTIVASFSADNADSAISCLVKLITTTKMKVICNLGVWCIAIQQLDKSYLSSNLNSILMAVAHALDNPFGSLSITYEAMQVVIMLSSQLNENMRDLSGIWAPLIYRRLLSSDKRERDISERCLLKIFKCISSPPTNFSKILLKDIEQSLLPVMKEGVQDQGKHIYTIRAWGWFMHLLGNFAAENKFFINEMLKIPERTFSSSEPKVLIATLTAWEALVEVFFSTQLSNTTNKNRMIDPKKNESHGIKVHSKTLKLLMSPLVKIFSRKNYEISVHSACFKFWRHLLFNLDSSIANFSIIKAALEPALEAIFCSRFSCHSAWLWSMCLDLLEDLVASNPRNCGDQSSLAIINIIGESMEDCSISWDFSFLELFLKMIQTVVRQLLAAPVAFEGLKGVWTASLRIFKRVLGRALMTSEMPSTHFEEIGSFIKSTLKFIRDLCEELTSKPCTEVSKGMLMMATQFVSAVGKEFKSSKLDGSLCKVPLDLEIINSCNFKDNVKFMKALEIHTFITMDGTSPMFYLIVVYYSVVAKLHLYYSGTDFVHSEVVCFLDYVFSSGESYKNAEFLIFLLYAHGFNSEFEVFLVMEVWKSLAVVLKGRIIADGNFKLMEDELDQSGRLATYWFLCYPLIMCYVWPTTRITRSCLDTCADKLSIEFFGDTWKRLFNSAICASSAEVPTLNSFCNALCKMLVSLLMQMSDPGVERILNNLTFFSNLSEIVVHVVKQIKLLDSNNPLKQSSGIRCAMELVCWFLRLAYKASNIGAHNKTPSVSSIYASMIHFVNSLSSKQDILEVIEVMSDDLVSLFDSFPLSYKEMQVDDIFYQLKQFWTIMLDVIKRELPPEAFDSSLLTIFSPLIEATIDHQCSTLSNSTITFWNSTFGNQTILNYPQGLLSILAGMSKEGKIGELKVSFPFSGFGDNEHPINVPSVKQVSCPLASQFVGEIKKKEHGFPADRLCTKRIKSEASGISEMYDGFNLEEPIIPFFDSKRRRQQIDCYQDRELRKTESILKMLRR